MNAAKLLDGLQKRGATVSLTGDGLDIEAPHGVLTQKVLAALKSYKPALIELLAAPPAADETETVADETGRDETPDKWWLLDKYRLPPISERRATAARVVVADPTPAQVLAATDESRNEAARLLAALRADGVRVFVSCRAGRLSFDWPRLCVEYERIARDDWHALYRLRAEIYDQCQNEFESKKGGANE